MAGSKAAVRQPTEASAGLPEACSAEVFGGIVAASAALVARLLRGVRPGAGRTDADGRMLRCVPLAGRNI